MRFLYLGVLAVCLAGTALPLELRLRTRVFARRRRLLLAVLPTVVIFTAWDVWAIGRGHWDYDPRQTVGLVLPGRLPIEELLFFIVIPICGILSFEAVRAVRGASPGWSAGDE